MAILFKRKSKVLCLLILSLITTLCTQVDPEIDKILKGNSNRNEILKALRHFKNEGNIEKYKAAEYLIRNAETHFTEESSIINEFYKIIINSDKFSKTEQKNKSDSLRLIITTPQYVSNKKYDLNTMTANYIIKNVNLAYTSWKEAPWADSVSFDTFCEYILPYRISKETLKDWRTPMQQAFAKKLKGVTSMQQAASIINDSLIACKKDLILYTGIPSLPYDALWKVDLGNCVELTALATFAMRANGIPVAQDYTPLWADEYQGHTWNVLILPNNRTCCFQGSETRLNSIFKDDRKISKAFRYTFASQINTHAVLFYNVKGLPDHFYNQRLLDVTDQYTNCGDIVLKLNMGFVLDAKVAYLSIFDNVSWKPIYWSAIKNGETKFAKIGVDIVYLPVLNINGENPIIQSPFIYDKNKQIHSLDPDTLHREYIIITRKYPLKKRIQLFLRRMEGACFQVANKSDFSDAKTIHKIIKTPQPYFQEVTVNLDTRYRYIRYLSGNNSYGNVSELEFYSNSNIKLSGKIIGTAGSFKNNPACTNDKAFDDNLLTFFDSHQIDSAWVGLDLGSKRTITKIRFMPRNDYNTIVIGNDYELFYYDNKWVSLGRKIAKSIELNFNDVPKNALLLLHNHSGGKEERIFTYENGVQTFW